MRIFRFLTGLLLIPFCVIATQTAIALARYAQEPSDQLIPSTVLAFSGGFVAWLIVFFLLPRPVRTYVLAHELTHALWGSMMGAEIKSMRVSRESGSVTLSKTNFFITLAPYFFPLYTVLVILGYYLLSVFYDVEKYGLIWLGLVGITWGFHLTFTITTLMQKQSDIHSCGYLFSYAVIYFMNIVGISLWIVIVSSVTLEQFVGQFQRDTVEAWRCGFRAYQAGRAGISGKNSLLKQ